MNIFEEILFSLPFKKIIVHIKKKKTSKNIGSIIILHFYSLFIYSWKFYQKEKKKSR